MKRNDTKMILYFLVTYLLYRLTLDYIYVTAVVPFFDYQHFEVANNMGNYVFSFVWLGLICLFDYQMYKSLRPSASFMWFFDLLFFVPLTAMVGIAGYEYGFVAYSFIFWLLFALFYMLLPIYSLKVSQEVVGIPKSVIIILGIVVLINFLITIYYNGFQIKFDLADVYDIRLEVRDMHLPTIVGYIKPMATQFLMILLCFCIIYKKYIYVFILVIVQLSNFAFGALKSDLFILLAVFLIGFFYKEKHRKLIPLFLLLGNLIAILEYNIIGFSTIATLFHRRMMFIPPQLSSEFYSFFSTHEALYLRDSFLRFFGFSTPYSMEGSRLIGYELYGNPDMNANTGIVGDDFGQLRWLAVLVYPFLRVKILQAFDYCAKGLNFKVLFFLAFSFSLSFISGSFFSILLTGGFFVVCLVLYLWKKNGKKKYA